MALGANARSLAPEDRAVTRELALIAAECGIKTVGEIAEALDALTPDQRRATIDTLRRKAGLDTATELDRRRALAEMRVVSLDTGSMEPCAVEGCEAVPRHPTSWTPISVNCRRWHCSGHRHLAAPGDMDPAPEYQLAAGGGIEAIPQSPPCPTGAGWRP
jgi:hypothetical protein